MTGKSTTDASTTDASATGTSTTVRCMRCNRPLSDPESVARGMGPVCAKKSGLEPSRQAGREMRDFHDARVEEEITLQEALILEREPRSGRMDLVKTNVPHLVVHHSPTGFEWGYPGSGPADLALNIMHFFVETMDLPVEHRPGEQNPFEQEVQCHEGTVSKVAWDLHNPFKDEIISSVSNYGDRISSERIRQWILQRLYDEDLSSEEVFIEDIEA